MSLGIALMSSGRHKDRGLYSRRSGLNLHACFDCGLLQGYCDRWGSAGDTGLPCQFKGLVTEFLSIGLNGGGQRQRLFSHLGEDMALARTSLDQEISWALKGIQIFEQKSCDAELLLFKT